MSIKRFTMDQAEIALEQTETQSKKASSVMSDNPYSVLIVDDEMLSQTVLQATLSETYTCHCVSSGKDALAWLTNHYPDLIVLDMNMPGMSGLEVCQQLKAEANTAHIPVIFVTATDSVETQNACWEAGASDFVQKPIVSSTLLHRVRTHIQNKKRIELLNELTFKDHLTKAHNRYYLSNEVPHLLKQVARDMGHMGVIIVDIDHFKGFNDNYGHLMGDECLKTVSATIQSLLLRPSDKLIRFGGEEFLVLLPYTDKSGCKKVAEGIVEKVSSLQIENAASARKFLTISAGYHSIQFSHGSVLETLIGDADLALFDAKESGKNKAVGA